ncbi:hypothetical protein SDC9_150962 [bioreactor metagenome]|uniref:Uncharacterized protein n=1 Tax=bioreactor metagenome TaxID=1076179 RepID=A0A645EQW4_9ZZZZ
MQEIEYHTARGLSTAKCVFELLLSTRDAGGQPNCTAMTYKAFERAQLCGATASQFELDIPPS